MHWAVPMLNRTSAVALLLATCAIAAPGCNEFEPGPARNQHACGTMYFARDPATHECRPIQSCGPDVTASAAWEECGNPCEGMTESACSADERCQRVFDVRQDLAAPCSGFDCPRTVSTYMGCHAVPTVRTCSELPSFECSQRPDCQLASTACSCETSLLSTSSEITCNVVNCTAPGTAAPCQPRSCMALDGNACLHRSDCLWDGAHCRPGGDLPCGALAESQCLARRDCRAIGASAYCPPDTPDCKPAGFFSRCEDDRPPEGACHSDSDCSPSTTCSIPTSCLGADGAPPSCLGQCTPIPGCASLDEAACANQPSCAPKYIEVCAVPPGTPPGPPPPPGSPYNPSGGSTPMGFADAGVGPGPTTRVCPTVEAFAGCIDLRGNEIIPDRSLLILEPSVLDAPELTFPAMMTRLAGGDPSAMVTDLLNSYTTSTLINDRVANARQGMRDLLAAARTSSGLVDASQLGFRPVAISNRLDLVSDGNCGEARLVFANDRGAFDPSQRMTIIFEFGVPLDGAGCRIWAARWAALSQLSTRDPAFRRAVLTMTAQLFDPAHLNQLRSNELFGRDPSIADWELREFHLVDGRLVPQPCTNSPDPAATRDAGFIDWLRFNQSAVSFGRASVPKQFLAATSITVAANRLTLPGDLAALEKPLNLTTCNGCHRSETGIDFVHVTERRFAGRRATISSFLRADLQLRGQVLRTLLGDSANATVLRTRAKPAHH